MAEPLPHLRAQEVGKVGLAGPDCRHKGGPIGLFAEVSFFQPFGAGGVVGVDAHAGIDDGHQPDALRFQVGGELRKVRKPFLVYGKIGIVLHILDVHTDHVQRQVVLLVLACNFPHVLLGLVAPAALCQTECPLGWDIAAADEGAELLADRILVPAGEEIQIIVGGLGVEREKIVAGIADVVIHLAREIHEQAKAGAAVPHQQEIVRTIEGKLVLAVAGFVGVVGDVVPAALVDAAGHFAQTVDRSLLTEGEPPAGAIGSQKGDGAAFRRKRQHNALGGEGMPERKTLDHRKDLLFQIELLL